MRLLIVSQYFRPENFRINDLAQGLIKLGHQVMVLTGKSDYSSGQFFDGYSFWGISREMFAGIEVIRVPLVLRGHGGATRLVLNFLSLHCSPVSSIRYGVEDPSMSSLATDRLP